MAGTRKAPAKKTAAKPAAKKAPAKKAAPAKELELRDDGFWWYGDQNFGRNKRYAENMVDSL